MAGPILLADEGVNVYLGELAGALATTTWTPLPKCTNYDVNEGTPNRIPVNTFDTPRDSNETVNGRPNVGEGSVSFILEINDATQALLLNNSGSVIPIRFDISDGTNIQRVQQLFEIGNNDLASASLDEVKNITVQLSARGVREVTVEAVP